MFQWNERGCRKYQIRMEDYAGAAPQVESDPELAAHLHVCVKCRESLAAAELSAHLFTEAGAPDVLPTEAFVTRVMASIREEEMLRLSPAPVWRPLEALASRFALVASLALLALSVFVGEISPVLRQNEVVSTGSATTEITNDWPEPPPQPATQDEVLMSLVDVDNGI